MPATDSTNRPIDDAQTADVVMRRTLAMVAMLARREGRYASVSPDYLLVLILEHADAALAAVAALDRADAARAADLRAEEDREYGDDDQVDDDDDQVDDDQELPPGYVRGDYGEVLPDHVAADLARWREMKAAMRDGRPPAGGER